MFNAGELEKSVFKREHRYMETSENKKPEETVDSAEQPKEQKEDSTNESASILSSRSLRKLRDRVERAAHELRVLRDENTSLQERVAELEAISAEKLPDGNAFFLESDPESVKRKVEGFIQAIDRYLDDADSV